MPAWPCEHDSLVVVVTVVVIDQELMPVIRIPFAVTGLTEYCTIFHFPLSVRLSVHLSVRHRRDISTFLDNLMV